MWNSVRSRLGLTFAVAIVAAFAAVPAYAQTTDDPTSAQYDAQIPDSGTAGTAASGGSGDPGGGLDSSIGSLPFTGMDLLIVAGVALVLTGTGFALRRLSTPRGPIP